MFGFSIKKMFRNKWMMGCLLVGFIISIAVISCIPIYTGSILQRLLVKDLEAIQEANPDNYPGNMLLSLKANTNDKSIKGYQEGFSELVDKMDNGLVDKLGVSMQAQSRQTRYYTSFIEVQKDGSTKKGKQAITLNAKEKIEEHCELIAGELPSNKKTSDGVVEVMVTEEAYNDFVFELGKEYDLTPYDEAHAGVRFKVVGIFTYKDPADLYWYFGIRNYNKNIIMNFDLFMETFYQDEPKFEDIYYFYTFDYHNIKMKDVPDIMGGFYSIKNQTKDYGRFTFEYEKVFTKYLTRQLELNLTLWVLLAPVVLMLLFYIFMISTLIMEHEKNDISLLKSRGANNLQVFVPTMIQTLIVSVVAVVIGTVLGYYLVSMLGLSNGFLEFVNRKGLSPTFSFDGLYITSVLGIIITGIIAMFIPAIKACKLSIVEYKRDQSKLNRAPFWKRIGLDIIVLALSCYALYNYRSLTESLSRSDTGTLAQIDPVLFLINTLFILGLGLVFLRIFPYIVKLIYLIGKRFCSPELYVSLLSISRSNGKEQFIILFLIFTISLAMFNATAARTLNTFMEDRTSYAIGTDLVMQPSFPSETSFFVLKDGENPEGEEGKLPEFVETTKEKAEKDGNYVTSKSYMDVPTTMVEEINGIETVTKVFTRDTTDVTKGKDVIGNVEMMSIIPDEFAKVAWMRKDLLPYHINEYLNLLAQDPQACLLSTSMQEKGIKVGDAISISWKDQPYAMECVVYGFVDYWPSFNPVGTKDSNGQTPTQMLAITNFSLFKAQMKLEPYKLWASVDSDVPKSEIYRDIENLNLDITGVQDTQQALIKVKNDPMLQGINGTLTLSFIVTLLVTLIGFLIFWILNIKERTLQFGILRAMGLSKKNLVSMLIFEQIFISGGAVLAGLVIGTIVNNITVPLLQYLYAPSEQVPPFKVYMQWGDYAKIFIVIGIMILIGILVLGRIINKIKIDQALKLGED